MGIIKIPVVNSYFSFKNDLKIILKRFFLLLFILIFNKKVFKEKIYYIYIKEKYEFTNFNRKKI